MSARGAEKNNEKLFPIFRKNLSDSNVSTYATTADKLAIWAARDKAYYPFARAKIVELLETAHAQVRRFSNIPDQPFHITRYPASLKPWAEPFIRILRTVAPFYNLFTEPHLQARLRALLQTIDADPLSSGGQPVHQPPAIPPPIDTSHVTPPVTDRMMHSASPVVPLLSPVAAGFSHLAQTSVISPVQTEEETHPSSAQQPPAQDVRSRMTPASPLPLPRSTPAVLPISVPVPLAQLNSTGAASLTLNPLTSGLATLTAVTRSPSATPKVNLGQSVSTTGPSSNAPLTSALPSPVGGQPESASAPPKTKTKKKKKRLTEDDFIMADLADWSARSAMTATPTPPIATESSGRRGSTPGAAAEPKESGTTGPTNTAEQPTSAAADPADNGNADIDSRTAVSALPGSAKDPAPAPAPAPAPTAQSTVEVDLYAQIASATPKAKKKRKGPPGLRVLPSGDATPPVKKKSPPGLQFLPVNPEVAVELSSRSSSEGDTSKTPDANTKQKKQEKQRGRHHEGWPSSELAAMDDVVIEGGDAVSKESQWASGEQKDACMIEESSQPEGRPPKDATLEQSEQAISSTEDGLAPARSVVVPSETQPPCEDVTMTDGATQGLVESISEPMDLETSQSSDVVISPDRPDNAVDVWEEAGSALAAAQTSTSSATPLNQAFSAQAELPDGEVPTAELLASGSDHAQQAIGAVPPQSEDVDMDADKRVGNDTSAPISATTDCPSTMETSLEGVINQLAEQKGITSNIVSGIINTVIMDGDSIQPDVDRQVHSCPQPASINESEDDSIRSASPAITSSWKRPLAHPEPGGVPEGNPPQRRRTKSPAVTPATSDPDGSNVVADPVAGPSGTKQAPQSPVIGETRAEAAGRESLLADETLADIRQGGYAADKEDGETNHPETSSAPAMLEDGEIRTLSIPDGSGVPAAVTHVDADDPLVYSELSVLACQRGSADDSLVFDFDVDPALMASISQWVTRYSSQEDVTKARCISVAGYPFNECMQYVHSGIEDSYERMSRSVVMQWPKDGRLWAELTNAKGAHRIALSPPFMRKTDGVVDISDYVITGRNTLRIYQLRDHSEHIFALSVHSPVDSQVQELQRRRDHDTHWKSFLRSLSIYKLPDFPCDENASAI